MPKFDKIHSVSHRAEDMYALVADVERYPEFLPLCEALKIRSRRDKGNKSLLIADMTVGYKAIRETFTSQVMLDPDNLVIDVKYLDGPFRYLTNVWRFVPTGDTASDVHFHIDYEFRSRMLGMLMGAMFDTAFSKFTTAFEERADKLYA
ncbi:MAG: type II toxin-antitoxin system RatA family toxin [Nitratireductor sp.]|nr:type II toxin-antitoxin system RatA family toxin [Nitratireductor sp.]MCC0019556.1 type II toxin-antitoxin system RatA family toxin [Nitratireductor sp.]